MSKRDSQVNEIELKVFKMLLERFGEPIGEQPALVGVADAGPGHKKTYDTTIARSWNDPEVVREDDEVEHKIPLASDDSESCTCDEDVVYDESDDSDDDLEEVAPKGWEGTVRAMKKHSDKIDNPFALSNYMKAHGAEPHYSSRKPFNKKSR